MTVEEIRGHMGNETGNYDNFPVGMRVLAVDDDPICLKLLEALLKKCQYHVTTTKQARMALTMLRENKERFDLVISDVHMPDMDGFKLLELVGLEMDLPVIMLSANSDPKQVMKGITHGACDYLVKPVRIEELRNIWQHVIRRKKFDCNKQTRLADHDTGDGEDGGHGLSLGGPAEQSAKVNKRRKDDDDDSDDNGHDNDDPTAQKKPRVVWSIELHRKFVAAVNQLGIDKAVPKRILDLMNVDGLTRENVASHLQKYRLYLKRISSVATQQANMVAAFGGKDSPYMRMGSLDGLGDFRTLAGPGRFTQASLPSYNPGGMLSRLNSAAGLSMRNLTASSLVPQNLGKSFGGPTLGKSGPVAASLFQGIPSSVELDPPSLGGPTLLRAANTTFVDPGPGIGSSINPMMLQQGIISGGIGNPQSLNMAGLNSDPFNLGSSTWPSSLPVTETFNHARFQQNSSTRLPGSCPGYTSITSTSPPFEDSRRGIQCPERLVGDASQWGDSKGIFGNASSQVPVNDIVAQCGDDTGNRMRLVGDASQWGDSSGIFGNVSSRVPINDAVVPPLTRGADQRGDDTCNRMMDGSGQSSIGSPSILLQHNKNDSLTPESRARYFEEYLFEPPKTQGIFPSQGFGSLDDLLISSVIKQEEEGAMLEGNFGFDVFPFGPCI